MYCLARTSHSELELATLLKFPFPFFLSSPPNINKISLHNLPKFSSLNLLLAHQFILKLHLPISTKTTMTRLPMVATGMHDICPPSLPGCDMQWYILICSISTFSQRHPVSNQSADLRPGCHALIQQRLDLAPSTYTARKVLKFNLCTTLWLGMQKSYKNVLEL